MGFLLELRAVNDDNDNEEDRGKKGMIKNYFSAVLVWE
jgi:hypothetical protein